MRLNRNNMFEAGRQVAAQVIHLWVRKYMPIRQVAATLRMHPEMAVAIVESYLDGTPPPPLPVLNR